MEQIDSGFISRKECDVCAVGWHCLTTIQWNIDPQFREQSTPSKSSGLSLFILNLVK